MEQTCRGHHTGSGRAGVILLALALAAGSLAGCGRRNDLPVIENGTGGTGEDIRLPDGSLVTPDTAPDAGEASVAQTGSYDAASVTAVVTLTGDGATVSGSGVSVSGSVVTFTSAGTYLISGDLADGQLIVDTADATADATADTEKVRLVLNGVSVACSTGPAVFVHSSPKKTVLYTAAGSVNLLSDGSGYTVEDAEQTEGEVYPNACVYACDDLRLDGEGTLRITGNADKGVNTKDDLEITGGTLIVTMTVTGEGDGLKSAQTEKDGKGWVSVSGGSLYITAIGDGISAATDLTVSGGTLVITALDAGGKALTDTGNAGTDSVQSGSGGMGGMGGFGGGRPGGMGGDGNSSKPSISAKGLKAAGTVTLAGGKLTVTAADDGIHADDTVLLQDGEAYIRSGDDGVHADRVLTLSDGSLEIAQSYEGLEAAQITVSGGRTRITASDDGINASSGGGSSMGGGRPGGLGGGGRPGGRSGGTADGQTAGGTVTDTLTPLLTVSGGYTAVYASGDGIDSNGNIVMTGGTLLVFGPTDNGNGAIDYGDGNCSMTISGGTLLAVGSSGMAETATGSGQAVFDGAFRSSVAAGTLIGLCDADGNLLCGYRLPKIISSIVFSSAALTSGATYTLVQGGTADADGDGVLDLSTWTGYSTLGSRAAE